MVQIMDVALILFFLLGLLSGVLGGLLGIGGGVITVPALYFLFHYTGLLTSEIMKVAVSTSLAAAIFTSGVSTLAQMKKRAIRFPIVRLLAPGLVIGCIAGSITGHLISSDWLRWIFGLMAILLGIYYFFPRLPALHISSAPNRTLSLFGFFIGGLSSILGIGGGSLSFPILLGYQVPVAAASANSSASTFITTIVGTATYLAIAWHRPELPDTFGYIELPAFIAISVGSMLLSPFGVKLSHILNVSVIKRVFGVSLFIVGLSMLLL